MIVDRELLAVSCPAHDIRFDYLMNILNQTKHEYNLLIVSFVFNSFTAVHSAPNSVAVAALTRDYQEHRA